MSNIEILSPVGSPESLVAAVRSGADAVYLGAKNFSARRNATNFKDNELLDTVKYCHNRNVKVYVTVNIMVKPNEVKEAVNLISYLNSINVDGIIVQDLGLARIIHDYFPDMPIIGSTQMSVSSISALPILKEMGFARIVVARELSKNQLIEFCAEAKKYDIEVEPFVHGALCMSVSGQCLLSAMIGQRSGNRGLCAQPCRLPFKVSGGTGNDLSLKDNSLYDYVREMDEMGVASLKIEGRMKRPEYISMATYCCRNAVDGKPYDTSLLKSIFSRSGFTDGYYTGKLGRSMFGTRTKEDVDASSDSINKIHELYRYERNSVALDMHIVIKKDEEISLTICDGNNEVTVKGESPLLATGSPVSLEKIKDSLGKLGNTPFYLNNLTGEIEDGLFVRNSLINGLRRDAIEKLEELRMAIKERRELQVKYSNSNRYHSLNKFIVRVASLSQLASLNDEVKEVIFPVEEDADDKYEYIVEIPRWIVSEKYIKTRLEKLKAQGVKKAYCNSLAAINLAKEAGLEVIGGNFLNIGNSESALTLEKLDINHITTTIEFDYNELNAISTKANKGLIGYGRVPLMLTVNCPLKNGRTCDKCDKKGYIVDRMNTKFPIRCHLSASELLNSKPIYLADKLDDFSNFDYMILYFTIEDDKEVKEVVDSYLSGSKSNKEYTRGLYYRSVL